MRIAVPAARDGHTPWMLDPVAVSGEVDHVTDGRDVVTVPGGDILLTRVTGVGCAPAS